MAGGGRAGAGGRARPGGPPPGVPAPAAAEEEDVQIHSEGRATELGAVSGLLSHPSRGRGRLRRTAGASGSLPGQARAPFLLRGLWEKILFGIRFCLLLQPEGGLAACAWAHGLESRDEGSEFPRVVDSLRGALGSSVSDPGQLRSHY